MFKCLSLIEYVQMLPFTFLIFTILRGVDHCCLQNGFKSFEFEIIYEQVLGFLQIFIRSDRMLTYSLCKVVSNQALRYIKKLLTIWETKILRGYFHLDYIFYNNPINLPTSTSLRYHHRHEDKANGRSWIYLKQNLGSNRMVVLITWCIYTCTKGLAPN